MKRFKNMSRAKKLVAAGLTVGLTVGLAGAAFAFFTSSGTGTGSASVGTATSFHVTSSTAGGPMYPGNATTDETVTVNVNNPGTGAENLTSFTISVANSGGSAWDQTNGGAFTLPYPTELACSAADFALGTNAIAGSYTVNHTVDPALPDDLAAGATYTTTVNLAMLDTGVAQDNCQGLTTVPLYISATS